MRLPAMPPYIYGRETGQNEKVWTEYQIRGYGKECYRAGLERAAKVCEEHADSYRYLDHDARECADDIRALMEKTNAGG